MIAPKATFLTLVACFTLSPATIAQPQLLQNYIDLSREFKTTAAAMLPAMPRVSDTNELWNRVNRAQDAVRNNSYGYSDILSVSNVCAEAQENTSLYVRYNVDPLLQDSTAEVQQVEKQVTPQELSNMREFANELKVFMPFVVDCVGIMSSLVEPYWDSLDKDQQLKKMGGLNLTRSQILQTYNSIFTLSGAADNTGGLKSATIESALKAAPAVAKIMTPPNREIMSQSLRKYSYSASAAQKSTIGTIENVFADKTCNSICQLQ